MKKIIAECIQFSSIIKDIKEIKHFIETGRKTTCGFIFLNAMIHHIALNIK